MDGRPVDDVQEVIDAAADEPRYLERAPALEALLADGSAPPYDRFLATYALASWGNSTGLRTVAAAAAAPQEVLWRGVSLDRRYSVDDTFTLLADAVAGAADYTELNDTEPLRLDATRALVSIAPDIFYDWQLKFLLDARTLPHVRPEVEAALRAGTARLAGAQLPFPLGPQLADLAAALVTLDETAAVEYGHRLAAADSSLATLRHLLGVVSHGTGRASLEFADYLATQGGDDIRTALAEALAGRTSG